MRVSYMNPLRCDRHHLKLVMNTWEGPLLNPCVSSYMKYKPGNEPEPQGTTWWYPYSPKLKLGNNRPIGPLLALVFICCTKIREIKHSNFSFL